VRAVTEQGYTTPTPIQAQAIPVVLAGKDLLGAAQTGTGKTAAFALPILNNLAAKSTASHSPARHPVRCLVVTPTRELAAQVEQDFRTYGQHLKLKSTIVFGGVGMQPQVDALRRGVDILVATPGRLLDHVQQKTVNLGQVEILVLDEADRMLDMGFIHDIRKVLALLPKERQNLLFSATFPDEIRKLAGSFMKSPVTVEVARRNTPAELVAQVQHPVAQDRKRELLAHLVKSNDWRQVLVFCRTKHGANRLAQQLERAGIEADAIHGNKNQNHRTRTLARFKDNELRVLVATDIAARGLDIEALPHVVNYDLPHVAEDYVHRIGRTGRAGAEGEAVALVSHEERSLMAAIERLMNRKVEQKVIEGFEPGSASSEPREPREERGQRRHQQQRRPEQRHGQPRHNGNRGGQAGNRGGQGGNRAKGPSAQRSFGPRRDHRAGNAAAAALPAQIAKEREAQIAEARARMVAEGEPIPAPVKPAEPAKRSRYEPTLGAHIGNKRTG
jgi:ATP-dependent RNA helicase RhlE